MTVLISDDASIYLDDLIEILYKKEYFGFIESAEIYVANIYDFIFQNINKFPSKNTPIKLEAFGSSYIFYKSNTRTTWYIFFEKFNDNYLVTYIINNHCEEAKWF
jgi:hypothetical protein